MYVQTAAIEIVVIEPMRFFKMKTNWIGMKVNGVEVGLKGDEVCAFLLLVVWPHLMMVMIPSKVSSCVYSLW